eukprot:4210951-Amphidinium_carterae.1
MVTNYTFATSARKEAGGHHFVPDGKLQMMQEEPWKPTGRSCDEPFGSRAAGVDTLGQPS